MAALEINDSPVCSPRSYSCRSAKRRPCLLECLKPPLLGTHRPRVLRVRSAVLSPLRLSHSLAAAPKPDKSYWTPVLALIRALKRFSARSSPRLAFWRPPGAPQWTTDRDGRHARPLLSRAQQALAGGPLRPPGRLPRAARPPRAPRLPRRHVQRGRPR